MIWRLSEIDPYMDDIRALFAKNADHKHAQNYSEYPLFEYTKYARMGWDQGRMVYYSAGVERPEYNGSIRVICRHTETGTMTLEDIVQIFAEDWTHLIILLNVDLKWVTQMFG